MKKSFYKGLKIIGRFFCVYNICKTGVYQVYKHCGNYYFRPRNKAKFGQTINGVKNLVPCVQCVYNGLIVGFNEVKHLKTI